MGRKSQVEKFEARLNKKLSDEHAVNSRKHQKVQEEMEKYGISGVEILKDKGSIKEAAAVFSLEGMETFTKVFINNPMESAVSRALTENLPVIVEALSQKIEKIVEAKIMELLEGMTLGMQRYQTPQPQPVPSNSLEDIIKDTVSQVATTAVGNIVEFPTEPTKLEVFEETKKIRTRMSDLELVVPYLHSIMEDGVPTRSFTVTETLKQYNIVITNPTMFWDKLTSVDNRFRKHSYGRYVYEEKKFER